MNPYLAIVLVSLLGGWIIRLLVERLNLRHLSPVLPEEFAGAYDAERYRKSQEYLRETTRLGLISGTATTFLTAAFILFGGFPAADAAARSVGGGPVAAGLVFAAVLALLAQAVRLPFRVYRVFRIEEKYGFNRMTAKTFILDLVKSALLCAIIGGIIFSAVVAIFERLGAAAWLICWAAIALFQIIVVFVAPAAILPLFNKFTPLPEGALKTAIEEFARSRRFRMKGIFTMDASRRSTKSNAFFTGFGSLKRIVLFDTLLKKFAPPEIVAVLAHELGHFRRRHVLLLTAAGLAVQGFLLFLLSRLIDDPLLFAAFRLDEPSVYAGIVLFGFLASPLLDVFGVLEHALSRRFEKAADRDGAETPSGAAALISALMKLSADNLSNLTPHPLKVFLEYSHPPVLERIRSLRDSG
jgi:STE24 endopeptidase